MKRIRVLIADDHPLIVSGLTSGLRDHGLEVVGDVSAANAVFDKFAAVKPDVLVLDIRFAEGAGLDVARAILQRFPEARIVFYSQFDQDQIVREAYRIGGFAFLPKSADSSLLAEAIKQANAGQLYFLPHIAERLAVLGVRGDDSPQAKLHSRELEVFTLMATGHTNQEIAEQLSLSTKTISNISQAVKEKLGVHRPADITRLAVKHLLIEP